MKIKEKIITTMDQPEAMQEDRDNWNKEEMLEAAVQLINLNSENKGQVSKKSYPPNHPKRFIHRNPEIPDDSDSEYESGNENSVPASQESGIGSQKVFKRTPVPFPVMQ